MNRNTHFLLLLGALVASICYGIASPANANHTPFTGCEWNKSTVRVWVKPFAGRTTWKPNAVMGAWNRASASAPTLVRTYNKARADILVRDYYRPSSSRLGYANYGCSDTGMRVEIGLNQGRRTAGYLRPLALMHEVGHGMGLDHIDGAGRTSVMDPYTRKQAGLPTARDIRNLRTLYAS